MSTSSRLPKYPPGIEPRADALPWGRYLAWHT